MPDLQLDRLHHYVISVPVRVDERGSELNERHSRYRRSASSRPRRDTGTNDGETDGDTRENAVEKFNDEGDAKNLPSSVFYRLSAYGRNFFFNLTRNDRLVAPGLSVEYWSRDGLRHRGSATSRGTSDAGRCHYVGEVVDGDGTKSEVAISDCFGLVSIKHLEQLTHMHAYNY